MGFAQYDYVQWTPRAKITSKVYLNSLNNDLLCSHSLQTESRGQDILGKNKNNTSQYALLYAVTITTLFYRTYGDDCRRHKSSRTQTYGSPPYNPWLSFLCRRYQLYETPISNPVPVNCKYISI